MPTHPDRSNLDDDALVRAARDGDLEAFEELVARHRDRLYARAFSMVRQPDTALDLSQEAWIKGWQRLAQFQGESSFATWMTRIVINVCLDHLRRDRNVRLESLQAAEEEAGGMDRLLPPVVPQPTAGLERAELRQAIDEALGRLTPEHRTVLVLHEFEGMEYKEIARVIGISLGTVMSRLFYARRRLATQLAAWRRRETQS